MSLTKFNEDLNIISGLDDLPNDNTGISSEVVKQKFDEAGNTIKTFINKTLIVEIDSNNDNLQNQINTNTSNISNLQTVVTTKANATDVYTRADLAPFLQGGDTLIQEEVFTVVNSNNGNGTFTYTVNGDTVIGSLGASGEQIFTLTKGTYPLGTNKIEAIINDTLRRSVASGGLKEIDDTHIALSSPEGTGAEITIRYFERIGTIENTGLIQIVNGTPTTNLFPNKIIIDTSV